MVWTIGKVIIVMIEVCYLVNETMVIELGRWMSRSKEPVSFTFSKGPGSWHEEFRKNNLIG